MKSYIDIHGFFDYGHFAAKEEWKRVPKIVEYVRKFLGDESLIGDPTKISLKSDYMS